MDAPALRGLVGQWPLDDGQPISALDNSFWPRDDAETSPGRGYHFPASRQSAGQPIVAGWSYGWRAQVSLTHDSWTSPLCVFDAGYHPEKLARDLGDLDGERVAVLVRLPSGRCLHADPDRQPRTGRTR